MARPTGIEPVTAGLEGWRTVHCSQRLRLSSIQEAIGKAPSPARGRHGVFGNLPRHQPRRSRSPALTHVLLRMSLARGFVSAGGLRGSSAALIRSTSFAPASARRRACCCCSRVGGRPGSGGGNWIGVLSVSRAA